MRLTFTQSTAGCNQPCLDLILLVIKNIRKKENFIGEIPAKLKNNI
jgi:hypothetical protein